MRQHRALLREFAAMYPDPKGFTDSTAAARINGFLGGQGATRQLEEEIDRYGLTAAGRQALRQIVQRGR